MVNNITQIYIELRTQNFIQHNYEDLYTNIKKYKLQMVRKNKSKYISLWIMSWILI